NAFVPQLIIQKCRFSDPLARERTHRHGIRQRVNAGNIDPMSGAKRWRSRSTTAVVCSPMTAMARVAPTQWATQMAANPFPFYRGLAARPLRDHYEHGAGSREMVVQQCCPYAVMGVAKLLTTRPSLSPTPVFSEDLRKISVPVRSMRRTLPTARAAVID